MAMITRSQTISATIDDVLDTIVDGGNFAAWNPTIRSSRAVHGDIDDQTVSAMAARLPAAKIIDVLEARHDLHLDRPQEWREALTAFITTLD